VYLTSCTSRRVPHGSTAYSVETVYGGKGDLYTPDARPARPAHMPRQILSTE